MRRIPRSRFCDSSFRQCCYAGMPGSGPGTLLRNFPFLAAPTSAPAAHASVAAAVAGHDAATEAAAGSVAQVDQAGERVGGVDGTGSRLPVSDFRSRAAYFSGAFRQGSRGTQSEIVEQ